MWITLEKVSSKDEARRGVVTGGTRTRHREGLFLFFLTYNRIFNYISLLSTDKLVNAVYIAHFHWLAGGSSTKGSHGFHWIIFLARLSSFSA